MMPKGAKFPAGAIRGGNTGGGCEDGERKRAAIEKRKFARLQAAIHQGIDGPDDPDFSFDKLRASLSKPRIVGPDGRI
jgi:hypothetical protein